MIRAIRRGSRKTARIGLLGAVARIITGTAPTITAPGEGETLDSVSEWGSYLSAIPDAAIIAPPEMSINGGEWEPYDGSIILAPQTQIQIRQPVTDTAGSPVRFFYSSTVTVGRNPPTAANALDDLDLNTNEAMTPIYLSDDFTGSGMTYALAPSSAPLVAGLTLSANGMLSGTPTAPSSSATIIIRGTNSAGFVDSAFSLSATSAEIEYLRREQGGGVTILALPAAGQITLTRGQDGGVTIGTV